MIRNLKMLGLMLVAALAMTAMSASAASATDANWTGGGSTVGHDNPLGVTELTGSADVKCAEATYDYVSSSGNTLTLTPTFSGCAAGGVLPVTITVNKCHYQLEAGTTTGDTAPVTAGLKCDTEGAGQIEVHVFLDSGHTIPFCTINIAAQPNLPGNLIAENQTNGHTRITGTVEGIQTSRSGLCGEAEEEAELHVDITGTNLSLH